MILITAFLLIVICGLIGFIFLRRSQYPVREAKAGDKKPQQIQKPKKSLAVYVIDQPANATICESVRKLHFRHFGQSQQLPALPLKDCDRKDSCHCFHREIVDKRRAQRRENRERREEFRLDPTKPAKVERRVLRDRRAARTEWDGYDTDR
jgi:hypothetical protein